MYLRSADCQSSVLLEASLLIVPEKTTHSKGSIIITIIARVSFSISLVILTALVVHLFPLVGHLRVRS